MPFGTPRASGLLADLMIAPGAHGAEVADPNRTGSM
jgi:hypothetical protein